MRGAIFSALLLLGVARPVVAIAQEAAAPALDHVGIQAGDLDRSVRFYTAVLGLKEVPAPFPKTEARWVAFGNGYLLHIVAHGQAGAPHNKWDHFALACPDLTAMVARLDRMHVAWADMSGARRLQKRPDGVTQIFIRDPDGYDIELNDAPSGRAGDKNPQGNVGSPGRRSSYR